MGRWRLAWVAAIALAVCGALVQSAGAGPGSRSNKTLRFTALFLPGGRVVAHPPAGGAGDESYVSLKLVGRPGRTGSGTAYTIASKDGKSTRYRFRFTWPDGALGLVGRLAATASGGISQTFAVTTGTGAYRSARGNGTLGKRPGGQPGIVVTINLQTI